MPATVKVGFPISYVAAYLQWNPKQSVKEAYLSPHGWEVQRFEHGTFGMKVQFLKVCTTQPWAMKRLVSEIIYSIIASAYIQQSDIPT